MEYKRLNRGIENKLLQRTIDHNAALTKLKALVERKKWEWFNKSYCPQCQCLQRFDVRGIQHTYEGKNIIVGVSHTCLVCGLQIRKGLDQYADRYVGGLFKKDLTAKL